MDLKNKEEIERLFKCCGIDRDIYEYLEDLERIKDEILSKRNFNESVNYFNALGNSARYLIYNLLGKKAMCVCELTAILNLSQSTISHHINKLKQAGLIVGVQKAKFTYYQIYKNIQKKYLI
ncbi:MAG TPA: metalloregulator ArsR/SmtB family transcription factor [Candidatus Nanopelagicaceae bacterium]|nr:metalloregulator ArsR/SmtB family transcription factor [Candidatus Nanopelagicaceae bacterium]